MSKPRAIDWPSLPETIDEAGMSYKFADFFDHKYRWDACYVVLAWKIDEENVGFCDLAAPTSKGPWEFQNDSEECTLAEWKRLKVCEYIDGFRIQGRYEE